MEQEQRQFQIKLKQKEYHKRYMQTEKGKLARNRATKKYMSRLKQFSIALDPLKADEQELIEFLQGGAKGRIKALYEYWKIAESEQEDE